MSKKIISLGRKCFGWAAFLFFTIAFQGVHAQSWQGSGTEADPYQISTPAHLKELSDSVSTGDFGSKLTGQHFRLMTDIDLSSYVSDTNTSGTGWPCIGQYVIGPNQPFLFDGYFHGGGHKIYNLTINRPTFDYVGLFGGIDTNAVIDSLGVEIGSNGVIGNWSTGGLVGRSTEGQIKNCYVTGTIRGTSFVGGLAGVIVGGSVTNCYTRTVVNGTSFYTGGFTGFNSAASITNCYASGSVNGNYFVGGFSGQSEATNANISFCVAAVSSVKGQMGIGKIIGSNTQTATHCYANADMIISLEGQNQYNGTDKTPAELREQSIYADSLNWDFTTIWTIQAGTNKGLPYLKWQNLPPDPAEYTITVSADSNGSISPAVNQTVVHGESIAFTITPNKGYKTDSLLVDGVNVPDSIADGGYTFINVQADHSIRVVYKVRLPSVNVTGIILNKTTLPLLVNATEQLMATVAPENATNQNVNWTSSDNTIAAVSTTGLVTALREGPAVIIVTTADGGKIATCTLTVTNGTGIAEIMGQTAKLRVYPNPVTNGELRIENEEWAASLRGMKQFQTIQFYDQTGKPVAIYPATGEITEIDISHLPSGTYLVKVGTKTVKVIKN